MTSQQITNPLPLIDVAPVLAGVQDALDSTAEQVREALENVGFFSVVGHGISTGQKLNKCTDGRRSTTTYPQPKKPVIQ